MRGNNTRKLIDEPLLVELLSKFRDGVPIARLVRDYKLEVSDPHLRKLLFIYIDILDEELYSSKRCTIRDALFPAWVQGKDGIITQPNEWSFTGRFPLGTWGVKLHG